MSLYNRIVVDRRSRPSRGQAEMHSIGPKLPQEGRQNKRGADTHILKEEGQGRAKFGTVEVWAAWHQ